ncbi:MAG: cobaltochelatase subunit CobS [Proteobacteria bacterium]|nr:cobaltochelatase subunit CobS [Pseudomonadota bacterium]
MTKKPTKNDSKSSSGSERAHADKGSARTVKLSVQDIFGFPSNLQVEGFAERTEFVPEIDEAYHFDPETTLAILAGFNHDRRVLIQGFHGTGKSSHIEQVAARLNWPLIRINLDGHVSRIDLIGKDAIVLEEGKQVTKFREGFLPWAMIHGAAVVFDEYDAGRPDVMFVIQRLMESNGKLTLTDQNRVIHPHPAFRLFATANTIGLGDASGLYHGTNPVNQGQMDRWNIVVKLNYLPAAEEEKIVLKKAPSMDNKNGRVQVRSMVALAALTREGFAAGDISTVMSPRTVMSWADNYQIFGDMEKSFRMTFMNKCDEAEYPVIAEYYQRCFGTAMPELPKPAAGGRI